ncbi:MAG TPA: SMC-Scp complex subunit ScpB, partial [Dongiaceae bacterium]|nr:SMC-Scp complex subunit ScpB [Dongiaceae bacterium]
MTDDRFQLLRLLEAVLFATSEPLSEKELGGRMPEGADIPGLLQELKDLYANRGVHLMAFEDRWAFRTAPDLAPKFHVEREVMRKLSRAAIETLAIIAYHQPVTRAEIEEIRGVAISKGTLDMLLEIGWIKPKGRRETPGRPVTWATTDLFLEHFGLESCEALPGVEELKAAGLLDARASVATLGAQGTLPNGAAVEEAEDEEGNISDMLAQKDEEE